MSRCAGAFVALLTAVLVLAGPASAAGPAASDVLPDLDQVAPDDLVVKRVTSGSLTAFRLGFASAAANVGPGPLTLAGHRASRSDPTMDVNQLVTRTSGLPRVVRGVSVMSYVVHPDHKHWHLLGFERYELRTAGADAETLRRDRKTGFCLGDRFPLANAAALPGFTETPMHPGQCGLGHPDLLGMFSGMSTGYVDRYEAHVEGQYIDITGLPSGRYVLVHTVNPDGELVERDLSNNASSVLFALRWRPGRSSAPSVRVLRRCPQTATCP